jgi:hypothetical protein
MARARRALTFPPVTASCVDRRALLSATYPAKAETAVSSLDPTGKARLNATNSGATARRALTTGAQPWRAIDDRRADPSSETICFRR